MTKILSLALVLAGCALEVRPLPRDHQYPSGDPLICDATAWYDTYYSNYRTDCDYWVWCRNTQCYQCQWWFDGTEITCDNEVYYW
jgi:hypothetical protein